MKPIITIKNLRKSFINGKLETEVLKGIDFEVAQGEWLAIMGKSGAGKSTFLYQMSLLDHPTAGEIVVDGTDVLALNGNDRTQFRLERLGYVFQDYALVPELTAKENVMVPLLMRDIATAEAETRAELALTAVGLGHRLNNLPSQMSGGEQQRVSIARAIGQNPTILFADEPTANLDNVSSASVMEIMSEIHKKGQTIIMVTHEKEYTAHCDRIVYLDDGKIVDEEKLK